jgi:colicin import membrane protein
MNEVAVISPKPLTVIERAAAVFAAIPSEEDLRALAKKSATITEITNEAGKEQCHASRMVLKNTRLEIERVGEEGREDAVQTSRAIIARQKTLIGLTKPEEERLAAIQKAWDDRIAAEKEAQIQAEIARVAGIQERIEEIRAWPVHAATLPSLLVGQMLQKAEVYVIDGFEEFTPAAQDALIAAKVSLTTLLADRKAHEAEQLKLAEDRKELAKLRADAAERDRLEKIERDRLESIAKAERDAESARQAEANRLERQRIAEEESAARALRDAEDKRLADDRAAQIAEAREHAQKIARENAEREAAEEDRRRRNEMAMQEIQAIHHQLMIADVGRAPYCKGGDIQTMDWLLTETGKWRITEEKFGVLYQTAVKTLETTLAALRQKRVDLVARLENEAETARLAEQQAKFATEQAAAIEASKPKGRGRQRTQNPGREAIVEVLANQYSVDKAVVRRWLKEIDWESETA